MHNEEIIGICEVNGISGIRGIIGISGISKILKYINFIGRPVIKGQKLEDKLSEDELIKKALETSKTIAMVGVSSIKKEISTNIRRRPSTIVMKYMQEFGYKVIPVNPFSAGEKIHGETIVAKLNDIKIPVDIVDVFRPSKETPKIAKDAAKIGAKVFWLQSCVPKRREYMTAKYQEQI